MALAAGWARQRPTHGDISFALDGCRAESSPHGTMMGKMRDHLSRTEKYLEILFGIYVHLVCVYCVTFV